MLHVSRDTLVYRREQALVARSAQIAQEGARKILVPIAESLGHRHVIDVRLTPDGLKQRLDQRPERHSVADADVENAVRGAVVHEPKSSWRRHRRRK